MYIIMQKYFSSTCSGQNVEATGLEKITPTHLVDSIGKENIAGPKVWLPFIGVWEPI